MCTNSASSPASMRKRKVTFFDRVRIREIELICSDDWSETDEEEPIDSEYDYQTDLVRDLGEYDEALNTEPRKSASYKYSSKSRTNTSRRTLDFSGKVYSSAQQNFHIDRIDSKFLLLPSLKADRWKSSSSTPSMPERKNIPQHEIEDDLFKSESNDASIDSIGGLHRIREEGQYFQKGSLPLPSSMRRPSSTESLNRSKQSGSSSSSNSNWKRITSAPALMKRKKGSKNRPSLADSRNATFGSTASKNNRPPLLPTRWNSRKNIFLIGANESTGKSKKMNRISDVSDSSHTTCTSSTSTTNNPDYEFYKNLTPSEEFGEKEAETTEETHMPPMAMGSPKNRRNLLQRGMGSLRSLTTKSPKPRGKKGRNDMPPKRPIRLSSARKLQIEEL